MPKHPDYDEIPEHLYQEFMGFMGAHDNDELPDGAWWCTLEQAAEQFIAKHGLKADANSATHQYLWEKQE